MRFTHAHTHIHPHTQPQPHPCTQVAEAAKLRSEKKFTRAVPLLERAVEVLDASMGKGNALAEGPFSRFSRFFYVLYTRWCRLSVCVFVCVCVPAPPPS